jgi:hypothetical protein
MIADETEPYILDATRNTYQWSIRSQNLAAFTETVPPIGKYHKRSVVSIKAAYGRTGCPKAAQRPGKRGFAHLAF